VDDRRVALAALAVTAVVGVASPLIAWLSSRDLQKQAALTTRQQSDLSELRFVLDTALTDLNAVEARAQEKRLVWLDWTRAETDEEHVRQAQKDLDRALARARAAGDRVRIRLGQRAAYKSYWFAYEQFEEVGLCTAAMPPSGEDDVWNRAAQELHKLGRRYRHAFSDLAFVAVQSQLEAGAPGSPSQASLTLGKRLETKTEKYLKTCVDVRA
jgi:hypothetical protein